MFKAFKKIIWYLSYQTKPFQGKERLVALISRPSSLDHIKIERQGVNWFLQGHDLNEFAIAVRQNHSPILSKRISEEIEKNNIKVFWDIGANIGAITLPLLKAFSNLQAILFEPSAEVAGRLIRNLSNNPDLFQRSTIMNIALSDSVGIKNFYVSNEAFNSGVAGLGHSHNRFQFAVGVQTYTGDSLVESEKCPVPELIKIDVEGFELEVFRGLKNTLIQHHPTIIFEHSIYRLKERNETNDAVLKFLESVGYAIYRLLDSRKLTLADLDKDADFIAKAL
jgi:FkbM family methyltransferase